MMQTAPDVLYFKSDNGKYIYFVILGDHCPDHATFYSLFPEASQITERQYERALKGDVEMILVGDAKDVDRLEPEDETTSPLQVVGHDKHPTKKTHRQIPK